MVANKIYRTWIKPIADILLAFVLLLLLAPLMLLIALVNYLLYQHIVFVQPRPGYQDKVFDLYKFQTMHVDDSGRMSDEERLTSFGSLLRRLSLDELPQLVNIIKGEMSFVGPRPYLVEYLPLYNKEHQKRHYVKPGITGLAQVNGRNRLDWERRLDLDVTYVNNISFGLDLKVLLLTLVQLVKMKEVDEEGQIGSTRFTGYQAH